MKRRLEARLAQNAKKDPDFWDRERRRDRRVSGIVVSLEQAQIVRACRVLSLKASTSHISQLFFSSSRASYLPSVLFLFPSLFPFFSSVSSSLLPSRLLLPLFAGATAWRRPRALALYQLCPYQAVWQPINSQPCLSHAAEVGLNGSVDLPIYCLAVPSFSRRSSRPRCQADRVD